MGDQGWPGSPVARKREHGGNCPTSNRGGNEFCHYADRRTSSGRGEFAPSHCLVRRTNRRPVDQSREEV